MSKSPYWSASRTNTSPILFLCSEWRSPTKKIVRKEYPDCLFTAPHVERIAARFWIKIHFKMIKRIESCIRVNENQKSTPRQFRFRRNLETRNGERRNLAIGTIRSDSLRYSPTFNARFFCENYRKRVENFSSFYLLRFLLDSIQSKSEIL